MPSFKTSGKSKEDLSLVAQISGLLSAEETNRMTRTELVRFLEQENKKAEQLSAPVQTNQPAAPEPEPPADAGKRQIASRKRPNARAKATKDAETGPDPVLTAKEPVRQAELPAEGNAAKLRLVRVKKKNSPAAEPVQAPAEEVAPPAPTAPVAEASADASAATASERATEAPVAPVDEPAGKSGRPRAGRTGGRRKTEPAAAPAAAESASIARPGRRPKAAVVTAEPEQEADLATTEKKTAKKGGRRRVKPVTAAGPAEPVIAAGPATTGSAPIPEPVEVAVSIEQAEAASTAAPEETTAPEGTAAPELSVKLEETGKPEETAAPELTVKLDEMAVTAELDSAAAEITGQTGVRRQMARRGRKSSSAAQPDLLSGQTAATDGGQPAPAETEPIPSVPLAMADKAEPAGDEAAESSPEASEAATERELESRGRIIRHRSKPADREMTGPIERQSLADAAAAARQPAAQTPPHNRPAADGQYQPRPGRPVSRVQSEQTGVISRIPRAHTTNRATHTSIIHPSDEMLRERQDQEQPDQMPEQPREQRAAQLADQLDLEPGTAATATEAPPTTAPEIDAARTADMLERADYDAAREKRPLVETGESQGGVLEIMPDGYGFLRKDNYLQGNKDIYVPPQYIRRFGLRPGDYVTGPVKLQRENDRYQALLYIKDVNGQPPEKMLRRVHFDRLTPIYPEERFVLETTRNELSTRIIDLVAPIGKGQRGMIVSPPKAGKTILLQKIANAISVNNPDTKLIVLLIDERPEEVTDMQRSINGEVVYSTFDKTPENHTKVVELVLERAMRLVELKQDVIILLDSMTRLARAYNLTINPTGRTLSGGLDPGALYGPKRFFGAARNIENGGSLTIIATSLIETGSRMDEVIFEEFKGTGNMEVYLDRKLSEKRIFPAIDINKSGTRREELLMNNKELDAVWTIRKAFSQLDTSSVTEAIINLLLKTKNNEHFISSVNVSFNDKNVFEAMRGTRPGAQSGQSGQGGANPGTPGNGAGNTYNNTGYGSKYQRNPGNEDD